MGSKKTSISIVNDIKQIIKNIDSVKSKENIGEVNDICKQITEKMINKVDEVEKYAKKNEKLDNGKKVRSATVEFYTSLKKIEFPKKVDKNSDVNIKLKVKYTTLALIKALKDFINILKKQVKWYRKMWGHTSLLATKDNIACLEEVVKKLENLPFVILPKGLPNKGNQCYMNSAIQQLYKLKDFRERVLKFNPSSVSNGATDLQRRQVKALQELFKYLHGDINLTADQVEFYEKELGYKGNQEDSSEKMRGIMNSFNELIQPSKEPLNEYITDELNIVAEEKSIEDLFINYFIDEKKIKKKSFHPYILKMNSGKFIIHLNRTVYGGSGKNGCNVTIGEILIIKKRDDLFSFVNNSNKKIPNPKLELKGVTIQHGSSSGGHYFVYQKSGSRWICKNDSYVSQKSWKDIEEDVCTNATVLIYKLR